MTVKFVLQGVAHADGSPTFSARIFDDEAIAREAFRRNGAALESKP
jgi:hypothetical protein